MYIHIFVVVVAIPELGTRQHCRDNVAVMSLFVMASVAEPVLFGRSRCEGPAPGAGSTLDKTEELLNEVLALIKC